MIQAGGSKSNARRGREMELQLGRPVCRSEIILSTLMKKDGNYINEEGKSLVDKISEHLSQDQDRAATVGVPSKVNVYPDDAIGKVCGAEHSGRVRGIGNGICPSEVFGMSRRFTGFVNVGGSNQQCVEDLKKQVKSLEVKLDGYEEMKVGYEETKEQLVQTQKQMATLHKFLLDKFGGPEGLCSSS
ncbi:uncharacterized protein LOC133306675 isoform X2 [Gastrolobium bilobum]|uniref:uncharacterized protein LOC133306675 isoform X2 n=1 Tax=Gastrolobium bilobum TaxID=150636 RepID=UPI002AB1A29C|nr:uncharacterized protein LOC133306675 isoform X2 [Gastrolobium bilobum]